MIQDVVMMLIGIGVVLLASLIIGRLSSKIRVPRVTGYLVVGLLAGPYMADILGIPSVITKDSLRLMHIISNIALALIMFTIGGQFKVEALRRWGKRLTYLSAFEMGASFILISLATVLVNFFIVKTSIGGPDQLLYTSIVMAVFMGLIAIATAPAASVLVIREYESEGRVTDLLLALIGINNFVSIFLFIIVKQFIVVETFNTFIFLLNLFGPIGLGVLVGFLIAIWGEKLQNNFEYQVLLLGGIMVNIGIAEILDLDSFLSCFLTGAVVINSSPKAEKIFAALRQVDYPLYVLFFVIAGASLHIDALAELGLMGIVYIVMRSAGKLLGAWLGARKAEFDETVKKWVGFGLLAQAGVAIGLSQNLAAEWDVGGKIVQTIILGSVVVFELIGPIAVRKSLVSAGEVPVIAYLAKGSPDSAVEGFHHVIEQFRISLGIPSWRKIEQPTDIQIKHVMRKNVETIAENMPFNSILKCISHVRYDRFPVIDPDNRFLGMIHYSDIRDVLVDENLAAIVVARDLLRPQSTSLNPEQTLGDALSIFQKFTDITYLPVLSEEEPKQLVGIISQNDILATFRIPKLEQS